MKLLISGSRSITDFDLSPYIPPSTELLISGGAKGIDALAEAYADTLGIPKFIVRPRYELYGRAAPIRRNEEAVDLADAVLIVWDGVSRGTRYTETYARKKGKPVTVVLVSSETR